MNVKKLILISICLFFASIVLFSSMVNLYFFKDKIALMFKGVNSEDRPLNNSGYTIDVSQEELAKDIVLEFLNTEFEEGRHLLRINKI